MTKIGWWTDLESSTRKLLLFTPLLWVTGFLFPAILALTGRFLFWRVPRGAGAIVLWAWIAVSLAQALSVFITWSESGDGIGLLLRQWMSITVWGWAFMGLVLALGHEGKVATQGMARAMGIFGATILIIAIAALLHERVTGWHELSFPSLLGLFLPKDMPSTSFYFSVMIYRHEEFAGILPPRLTLFFPWSTGLALAGIGIFFISLGSEKIFWRILGGLGALAAIIFSFSRAGMVVFLLGLGLYIWLALPRSLKAASITMACIAGMVLILNGADPTDLADYAKTHFDALRSGSSRARNFIYIDSWDAFLHAPIFGHGWIGPSVHLREYLPIGSHSSFYGVLYTGGIVTFSLLITATIITLTIAIRASAAHFDQKRRALWPILLAMVILSFGETIYNLSLSCLPLFLWVGGALRVEKEQTT